MKSSYITILIILISTLISVIYMILYYKKKYSEAVINGLIMLICPLVGPVYYFGAFITEKIISKDQKMQMEDIGFSKGKRGRLLRPDYDTEIQTVPLEEVFIISQDDEKRKHLLLKLKNGYVGDYTTLTKALANDDAETAHYAATAISSAKSDFEKNIRILDNLYYKDGGNQDFELVRRYADYILSYLKSGILDKMEMRKYTYLYINIMTSIEYPEEFYTSIDYVNIVDQALELGDYFTAEQWAHKGFLAEESENSYLSLIKVCYYTDKTDELLDTLFRLKSSTLSLSSEGLDLIRFFMKQKN